MKEIESIQSKIKEALETWSSGSGIDCNWTYAESNKGRTLRASNSYHTMNENGFYDGFADFTVIIPIENTIDFKLQFNGSQAQYKNHKYQLRGYLEDIIFFALDRENLI